MKMKKTLNSKVLLQALIGFALFQSLANAEPPALDTNPLFEVGDKWTYSFQNIGDKKQPETYSHQAFKSDTDSGWIFGESDNPSASRKNYVLRYDYKRGDRMEGFNFDPSKADFRGKRYGNWMPGEDKIQFPLSVGKEYKFREEWSNGDGNTAYDVKVEAYEKIKVPAGEFDAYRIKFSGWWQRTTGQTASGRASMTQWFSPEAKRVIKIEYMDKTSGNQTWNQNITELAIWEPRAALPAKLASETKKQ